MGTPAKITINGTDYTSKIADFQLTPKENKKTEANVKGDAMPVPPRSGTSSHSIKLMFYYLTLAEYQAVRALYTSNALDLALEGFEIQGGNYAVLEFAEQLLKKLDTTIYNVSMTLQQDLDPQVPAPTIPAKTLAAVAQKLGW